MFRGVGDIRLLKRGVPRVGPGLRGPGDFAYSKEGSLALALA